MGNIVETGVTVILVVTAVYFAYWMLMGNGHVDYHDFRHHESPHNHAYVPTVNVGGFVPINNVGTL